MKLIESSFLGLCFVPILISSASAQITVDETTSTTVTPTETGVRIDDGNRAGGNLYHSFGEFSIPTGSEAFFNNASDIANIFSRVTGGNISNINGLIRANGAANLFLINPAGIVFGDNASLQLGGSFYGNTADSIIFPDGEFSASDLDNPPLITVNAPIGLGFRDNPGEIVNTSVGQNPNGETNITGGAVGLQVANGETLALVGGNVLLDDGNLTAKGGHIEIGSIASAGEVGITETDTSFALDYGEINSFGDITLQNTAVVDVTATGGGSVSVTAKDLTLDSSSIRSGIAPNSTSPDVRAGDIILNANESVTLTNGASLDTRTSGVGNAGDIFIEAREIILSNSNIITEVSSTGGIGNAGNINISTNSLLLQNGSTFLADTENQGNAGNILIEARDSVVLEGLNENNSSSQITSTVDAGTNFDVTGDAGNIEINTASLSITDGGFISTSTFGRGNGGKITINASESVTLGNQESYGRLFSNVDFNAIGNSGGVEINTGSLFVKNSSQIQSQVIGQGNSGKIIINAQDTVSFDGRDETDSIPSAAFSRVIEGGNGNSGGVEINTGSLSITDGGFINTSTFGIGNAGQVVIRASDTININGENSANFIGVFSQVGADALGDAGDLTIDTGSLNLANGGRIFSGTFGIGNAGDITINAGETISVDGQSRDGFGSGIFNTSESATEAESGGINITTGSLFVTNNALISAQTNSEGDAGTLQIDATESVEISGVESGLFSRSGSTGDAGTVRITTPELRVFDNAQVGVNNFIETGFEIETVTDENGEPILDTSGNPLTRVVPIFNPSDGSGNAGTLEIAASSLQLEDGGRIVAQSAGGDGGDIQLTLDDSLLLRRNSSISSTAGLEESGGNGGNININAGVIVAFPNENNDITANAFNGLGGNIEITAEGVLGLEQRSSTPPNNTNDIDASSEFGLDGNINLNILDTNNFRETAELSTDVVDIETLTSDACATADAEASGLVIQGKGGVPPTPVSPLGADVLLDGGKPMTPNLSLSNNQYSTQNISEPVPPVAYDNNGEPIYIARGVIKTEDGNVILTAYPTENNATRTPTDAGNCH